MSYAMVEGPNNKEVFDWQLREWFRRAIANKATHMVIVINNQAFTAHRGRAVPIEIRPEDDLQEKLNYWYSRPDDFRVCELYNMSMDMERQIAEQQAFHIKEE